LQSKIYRMKSTFIKILFSLFILAIPGLVSAQKATVKITGTAAAADIDPSVLTKITIQAIGHDNKEHSYTGVLLSDILLKAGVILGDKGKRDNISSYLIVRAKDNYKTIFTIPELDPFFTTKTIILADQVDGKPFEASNAPFQVIVPGEKLHARWIRQVVELELVKVK
jgi:hypothetical protein